MLYKATKKVPGGKLVRVKIEADSTINSIQISGDFFLHPEESLPALEKELVGSPASLTAAQFAEKVHEALGKQKATFIGVAPEDLGEVITEALAGNAEG